MPSYSLTAGAKPELATATVRYETTPPERGRRATSAARSSCGSGERLAAAAGAGGVRVVDRETGALQPVLVVERRARQVLRARGVDHDLHVTELAGDVVGGDVGVEEHLVAQAGTTTGAHSDPQHQLGVRLSLDELLHLGRRGVGQGEHGSSRRSTCCSQSIRP